MDTNPPTAKRLYFVRVGRQTWLMVELAASRVAGVPLSLFPTLARANAAQRLRYRPIGGGVGFHWPELDLDLSVEGIVAGRGEMVVKARRRSA